MPTTAAYVNRKQEYDSFEIRDWLTSPAHVEARFARAHGALVPDDYLALLEVDMHALHLECIRECAGNRVFELRGMLFHLKLMVNLADSILMLKQVYVRPCAEGHGLFRVLLFQLCRLCVAYTCDLYVEAPGAATRAVLERAFGADNIERHMELLPHMGERGPYGDHAALYMVVRCAATLQRVDLARALRMLRGEASSKAEEEADGPLLLPASFEPARSRPWSPLPPIVCNPRRFPSADALNYGPTARPEFVAGMRRQRGAGAGAIGGGAPLLLHRGGYTPHITRIATPPRREGHFDGTCVMAPAAYPEFLAAAAAARARQREGQAAADAQV